MSEVVEIKRRWQQYALLFALAVTVVMIASGLWFENEHPRAEWFRYVVVIVGAAWTLGGFFWCIQMSEAAMARMHCKRRGHRFIENALDNTVAFCAFCHARRP